MGYRPQLFDLEQDPHETRDLASVRPEIAAKLDRELRESVDYESVDAAAKRTDAAEFASWRLPHPGDRYLSAMAEQADRWDPDIAERFAAWAEAL